MANLYYLTYTYITFGVELIVKTQVEPVRSAAVSSNNVSSNNRQMSKYFGFVQKPVRRAVCSALHGTSVSQSVPTVCARRHVRARRPDICFLWILLRLKV